MQSYREEGLRGLKARLAPGRPRTLSIAQERQVLRWFRKSPREFGFPTELWTGARVAELIQRKFHKRFHPHYVIQWLAQRRITPQKPERQARERNEREVRRWLREEWPRIKKVLGVSVPT
jgi:transposase